MRALIFILISLFISSCQTSPPENLIAPPQLPSWYQNPPADTQQDLYAVGIGENPAMAVQNALVYLATKLSVSVSSTTTINKTLYRGVYQFNETQLDKSTTMEINQIKINQFSQLKMEQIGYEQFITLIKSNKQKLASDYKKRLDKQITNYQQDQKIYNQQAGYLKYLQVLQHFKGLKKFDNMLSIYQSLAPKSVIYKYLQHLKEVSQNFKQQASKVIFKIKYNQKHTITQLANYLTKAGFKVTTKNIATNTIKLTSSTKSTNAEGFYIMRSQLNVTFYEKNKLISGNIVSLKGQGLNQNQASVNQQRKLQYFLNKKGLNMFLGIKTSDLE